MSELPPGWTSATVAELIAPDGIFCDGDWVESKDQDPAGAIRLLQLADVGDGVFIDKSNRFINDEKFEQLRCTEVFEGDVLIARMPDPLGRACLAPKLRQRCITVVDVAIVRPGPTSARPRWLMHFLNAPPVRQVIELQASGTTRRRISRGNLAQLELPVPPLPEQKRIAEKLDALLARVDACRERLDRVPGILKSFRQSVLAAATSGELTREWREKHGRQLDWTIERAADVCAKVQSGGTPKEGFVSTAGVPFLKVYNIVNQRVSFDYRPQFVTRAVHQGPLAKSQVKPGDVLMNIVGPPLGKVAMVPADYSEWNINQALTLFRPSPRISTGWLYVVLCGGANIREIAHETKGSAGQTNVSLSQCRDFALPIPSVEEQAEAVRRVSLLFALAERFEARMNSATRLVEQLVPSSLATAFRGALVPQDPNDEPAELLLGRLSAAAVHEPLKTNTRMARKPKSRAASESRSILQVLGAAENPLPPDEVFRESGRDETDLEQVETFYSELRQLVIAGHVKETRPDSSTVLLALAP